MAGCLKVPLAVLDRPSQRWGDAVKAGESRRGEEQEGGVSDRSDMNDHAPFTHWSVATPERTRASASIDVSADTVPHSRRTVN